MKKLKTLLLGLALVLSLAMFNAATVTTRAADPQGGGEGTKHPPCYPRCRPVAAPTPDGDAPATSAASGVDDASLSNATWNEMLVLVLTQLALFP
jgi:hypothetical protein